jgi:hypothetical protein
MEELRRRWPDYVKGVSAVQLAKRISIREIAWAASVEPSLQEFSTRSALLSGEWE